MDVITCEKERGGGGEGGRERERENVSRQIIEAKVDFFFLRGNTGWRSLPRGGLDLQQRLCFQCLNDLHTTSLVLAASLERQ